MAARCISRCARVSTKLQAQNVYSGSKGLSPAASNFLLHPNMLAPIAYQQARLRHNRWNHFKFRKEKRMKSAKFVDEDREELGDEDEIQRERKAGRLPPKMFHDLPPFDLSCTATVMDPYIPPEGDGKMSMITKTGAKDRMEKLTKKATQMSHIRKIKKYEPNWSAPEFADEAVEVYREAHELLQKFTDNEDRMHELVTGKAWTDMTHGLKFKTLRWEFLESIEPPVVVHVRVASMINDDNLYGQVTVRLHTKQKLALYDRLGRLMYGSEKLAKDVVEYVVFEAHLIDPHGRWRIHAKITPQWAQKTRSSVLRTTIKKSEEEDSGDAEGDAGESLRKENQDKSSEEKSAKEEYTLI